MEICLKELWVKLHPTQLNTKNMLKDGSVVSEYPQSTLKSIGANSTSTNEVTGNVTKEGEISRWTSGY